jgi:hypothetical protein
MRRRTRVIFPVGAVLSMGVFFAAVLSPRRSEAINYEVDYIYYRDCTFTETLGERDIKCYGEFTWGDTSGGVLIRNYYDCNGVWIDCQSTCGYHDGYYEGCGDPGTPFAYLPPATGCSAASTRAPRPPVPRLATPAR